MSEKYDYTQNFKGKKGLHTPARPIRNLDTGEVYPSIKATCKALNISSATVYRILREEPGFKHNAVKVRLEYADGKPVGEWPEGLRRWSTSPVNYDAREPLDDINS